MYSFRIVECTFSSYLVDQLVQVYFPLILRYNLISFLLCVLFAGVSVTGAEQSFY
jgi:hypothetical protein